MQGSVQHSQTAAKAMHDIANYFDLYIFERKLAWDGLCSISNNILL